MIKRDNLNPKETYASQSAAQMELQKKRMSAKEFRDALTRANGAVVGEKTQAAQWNRWDV